MLLVKLQSVLSVLVHILAFLFLHNSLSPLKFLLVFINALAVVSSTYSCFLGAPSVVILDLNSSSSS